MTNAADVWTLQWPCPKCGFHEYRMTSNTESGQTFECIRCPSSPTLKSLWGSVPDLLPPGVDSVAYIRAIREASSISDTLPESDECGCDNCRRVT